MGNSVTIDGHTVMLTNLDKVYWPELNLTKGHMLDYYIKVSPYLLPHLKNRPFSMKPFPEGIHGTTFYQKEVPSNAPSWYQKVAIHSIRNKVVNWGLVNDLASLVWIANRGCIEMHTWFSRTPDMNFPDIAVLDLDPSAESTFLQVVTVANLFKQLLKELNLKSYPKTSGMSGLHIYIPIKPQYSFLTVRQFLLKLCEMVVNAAPELATLERVIAKRGSKIYLDAVQNSRNKTIPAPYSLRPSPEATVSTPLLWEEVNEQLHPSQFNFFNILQRIEEIGELFAPLLTCPQELPKL